MKTYLGYMMIFIILALSSCMETNADNFIEDDTISIHMQNEKSSVSQAAEEDYNYRDDYDDSSEKQDENLSGDQVENSTDRDDQDDSTKNKAEISEIVSYPLPESFYIEDFNPYISKIYKIDESSNYSMLFEDNCLGPYIHQKSNYMFFIQQPDRNRREIKYLNLEDENVFGALSQLPSVMSFTIVGDEIYFIDSEDYKIYKCKLDGSELESIVDFGVGIHGHIYIYDGKLYFVHANPDETDQSYYPIHGRTLYSINLSTYETEALFTVDEGATAPIVLHDLGDALLFVSAKKMSLSILANHYYLYYKENGLVQEIFLPGAILTMVGNQIITSDKSGLYLNIFSDNRFVTETLSAEFYRGAFIHNEYIYLGTSSNRYLLRIHLVTGKQEELKTPIIGYYIPYSLENQVAMNYTQMYLGS